MSRHDPKPGIPVTRPLKTLRLGGALLLLAWLIEAQASALDRQRELFAIADDALRAGDRAAYVDLAPELTDYPLFPYLVHRDLASRLGSLPSREVRAFLRDYEGIPVAGRLRKAWLSTLAKEGRWSAYLRDYRDGEDAEFRCWRRQALLAKGRVEEALRGVEGLWVVGRSQPEACDPVFARWRAAGGFTRDRIWTRLGLALDRGQTRLARYLKGLLPRRDRAAAGLWIEVHVDPALVLERRRFDPSDPRSLQILMHGLNRWSRLDSVAAAAALERIKPHYPLPRDELARIERRLALFITARGEPEGLQRLASLPPEQVDGPVRAWRIRAALARGDWGATLRWLDALPGAEAQEAPWRYWRARALEGLGRSAEAVPIYHRLSRERSYYGFLAAERLGLSYRVVDRPVAVSEEAMREIRALPGVRRARELHRLERPWEARVEWRLATAGLDAGRLEAAAKLAQGWGWHGETIRTLAKARSWDDLELRFPVAYREHVDRSARSEGIDPAWVFAVMRQESAFQVDARSPAGAMGLMQIMPATGRRIARRLDSRLRSSWGLLEVDRNIRYGAHYLRHTLDRLQGNPVLATAAYNAGPHRVAQWLPAGEAMEADRWAETIPYHETRAYVQRVLEYSVVYGKRLGKDPHTLAALMPRVRPALAEE